MRSMTMSQMLVNYVYAQLRDSTGKMRWTRDELTRYVNLALRDAITRRPEAGLIVDDAFLLRLGAIQTLEPGTVRLKEIVENLPSRVVVCTTGLKNDISAIPATITGQRVSMPVPNTAGLYAVESTTGFDASNTRTVFRLDTYMDRAAVDGSGIAYSTEVGVVSDAGELVAVTYRAQRNGLFFRHITAIDGTAIIEEVTSPNHRHTFDIDGGTKEVRISIDGLFVRAISFAAEAGIYDFTESRIRIRGTINQVVAANAGRQRMVTLYTTAADFPGYWPAGALDLCGNSIANQG